MKIDVKTRDVETSENVVSKQFSIKASGKAFKLLSSGLYKNKILAIVREISCNAYDSHIMAQNKEPFYVHLPNQFDNEFRVRDYGIGLSPEDMFNLFTTFFESTKTENNDLVGAFGLGSKSPFSYTTSFSAISYYNGVKYAYQVFLNDEDAPSIASLYSDATDEPNGLEISMPVESSDFYKFREAAREVYAHFPIIPTVEGVDGFAIPEKKVFMAGDGYTLYELEGKVQHKPMAIMGVVSYPIEVDYDNTWCSSLPLHVTFELGMLDITAGREELSYDKKTLARIHETLLVIKRDIYNRGCAAIKKCKTLREALAYYETFKPYLDQALPWKGRIISDVSITFPFGYDMSKVLRGKNPTSKSDGDLVLYHDTSLFYCDMEKGYKIRLKDFSKSGMKRSECYMFDQYPSEKIVKALNGWEIKPVSSLPKKTVYRAPRGTRHVDKVRFKKTTFIETENRYGSDYVDAPPFTPDMIYIGEGAHGYRYDSRTTINETEYNKTIASVLQFFNIDTLYRVPLRNIKRVQGKGTSLAEFIKTKLADPDFASSYSLTDNMTKEKHAFYKALLGFLKPEHPVAIFLTDAIKDFGKLDYWAKRYFKIEFPDAYDRSSKNRERFIETITKKYPMFPEDDKPSEYWARKTAVYISQMDELAEIKSKIDGESK